LLLGPVPMQEPELDLIEIVVDPRYAEESVQEAVRAGEVFG
jgi:hypothetical protein